MSFGNVPEGLQRITASIVREDSEQHADLWAHGLPNFFCPADGFEATVECVTPGDTGHGWSQDVAALGATAIVADLYAVFVNFTTPAEFLIANDGCVPPITGFGCGPGIAVTMSASVGASGDTYLVNGNSTTGSPVEVPTEVVAAPNAGWRFEHPASANDGGYLENPAPTWAVPDSNGNTFGRVLFTRAQLLAIADVDFNVDVFQHGGPGFDLAAGGTYTDPGRSRISVVPYNIIEEPLPTSSMSIVHYA
jgi:hypothetical protein